MGGILEMRTEEHSNYETFLSTGRQDACVRGSDLRHPVGPLPRPPRLQQLRHHEQSPAIPGSVVPHVRKDVHLYELVRFFLFFTYVFIVMLFFEFQCDKPNPVQRHV